MPNWMTCGLRKICRISLTAIVICAVPVPLWGQATLLSEGGEGTADRSFAGYDESVTKVADTLLASAVQTTDGSKYGNLNDSAGAALVVQDDAPPRPLSVLNPNSAGMRLDLLRPAIEGILRSHGVPPDLAAVILVESAGFPTALSPKGARGLWQFMPGTARRYGLRVDDVQDERLDLSKATGAAARYLHDLYALFGDWKLTLAAYNAGEANVSNAILRAHTQDFDQLARLHLLPVETRNYVPRVLAAVRSFGRPSDVAAKNRLTTPITAFATSNH